MEPTVIGHVGEFTEAEQWKGGVAMWAPLTGTWQSSTRAELAAMVLAMHMNTPILVGIDNRTVVDKGNFLIKEAAKAERQGREPRRVINSTGLP